MKKKKHLCLCFVVLLQSLIFFMSANANDTLKLPQNTKIIGREAFYGNQSINKVILSGNVSEIRNRAFANSSLSKINLPKSISYIAEDAFDGPDEVLMSAFANTYAYNWAVQHDYHVLTLLNWTGKISIPTASEIASYNKTTYNKGWDGRSPYVGIYLDVPSEGFTEYTADFRADYAPRGTYYSILYFTLSSGSLSNVCSRFESDTGGYAGFQIDSEGKPVVIMSIWDTFCIDENGNRISKFRPNIIYPDKSKCRGNGTFGDDIDVEGTGTGCIYDFDWKANHDYRVLIQQGQATNGNTTIIFWVCDLETKQWSMLFEYEVNRTNTHMTSGTPFLENFDPGYAGQIRAMELSNIRTRSVSTGQWVGVNNAYFAQNFDLPGSYNFGSEGTSFWTVTTGLPNRSNNPEGQRFYVQNVSSVEPY